MCLPFADSIFKLLRLEAGRGGDDYQIAVGIDGCFVGIEPFVDAIFGDVDFIAVLLLQSVDRIGSSLAKGVGYGDQLDVSLGLHDVDSGTGTATTQADDHKANFVGAGGMYAVRDDLRGGHEAGSRHGRGFNKIATGGRCRSLKWAPISVD